MIMLTLIICRWSKRALSYSIATPESAPVKAVPENMHSPMLIRNAAAMNTTAKRSANLVPSKDIPPYDMYSPL